MKITTVETSGAISVVFSTTLLPLYTNRKTHIHTHIHTHIQKDTQTQIDRYPKRLPAAMMS